MDRADLLVLIGEPLGVDPHEAVALQDADRLEALGALGLFRCVSTGTRMGARYFADDDPFARNRPLDDRRTRSTTSTPSCSACPPRCSPAWVGPRRVGGRRSWR
jgi:hypothetical protein